MEVYRAVSDFTAPSAEGSQNILSFKRGDKFEVFDNTGHKDWWGARKLEDNTIGYVPSKYMKHEELRVGSVLPENYQEHRERQLKRFSAMQNSEQHKHPEHAILDIPEPDYDPDAQEGSRNSVAFVEKFKNVICNIHIEELYRNIPEPDPDYQNDNDDDLPPPPSPLGTEDASQCSNSSTTTTTATSTNSGPTIIRVKNGSVSSLEDEGEQIQPRKLSNPCVESRERQALHKELLMNYKLGKDVLKKPELEKMLQKRKDAQKRKEWEEQKASKRTSFELKMEERANRLKADEEKMKPIQEKEDSAPELLRIHRKITSKPPS